MKWKTISGKLKDVNMGNHLIDWDDDQDSKFSKEVADFLHPYWKYDVVCVQVPVAGREKMTYDYVNVSKKIIMEVDGSQHQSFNKHFHGDCRAKYRAQIDRDLLKDKLAEKNGFTMIRIRPEDLPLTKEWVEETWEITL